MHGGISEPFWTLGGGTVLMFRYHHRLSKDIDIFVPDPQYFGFVSPRLSDVAAGLTSDYTEQAGTFVKLQFEEGEVDFVASPNLLDATLA
ncbi:MAG: nucleotidyl transferase AbiEii/AbiGii toxin family protein [Pseudoxanthomonas sp.]